MPTRHEAARETRQTRTRFNMWIESFQCIIALHKHNQTARLTAIGHPVAIWVLSGIGPRVPAPPSAALLLLSVDLNFRETQNIAAGQLHAHIPALERDRDGGGRIGSRRLMTAKRPKPAL